MLVLVTGGAGYVGCRLVPALLAKGYEVRVVDKLVFGASGLESVVDQIDLRPKDVRVAEAADLAGADAIIHLAGLSNDPTAEYNPQANRAVNTDATISLAKLAKRCGVGRFIFASSCSIYYTDSPDEELRDEDYPVAPRAPYSSSKLEAEKGLLVLADRSFCPVALRKGTIYGQSPRMRYDLVVNTFTRDAYDRRRLAIHAGGRMWRPMLHIDDAVDSYMSVLEAPSEMVSGRVFNVLSENLQVIKIAYETRRALETYKGIRLDLEVQQVGVVRSYRVDGSRFQELFDTIGRRDLGSAVSEMWDHLEGGIDVTDPVYYNIRWLELLCDIKQRLKTMGGSPL